MPSAAERVRPVASTDAAVLAARLGPSRPGSCERARSGRAGGSADRADGGTGAHGPCTRRVSHPTPGVSTAPIVGGSSPLSHQTGTPRLAQNRAVPASGVGTGSGSGPATSSPCAPGIGHEDGFGHGPPRPGDRRRPRRWPLAAGSQCQKETGRGANLANTSETLVGNTDGRNRKGSITATIGSCPWRG